MLRKFLRLSVIALILLAFAAVAVNVYWGGGSGLSASAANERLVSRPVTTPLNAITAFDVFLIEHHRDPPQGTGVPPLPTNEHKCAADVNNSGFISGGDVIEIRHYVLSQDLDFGSTGTTVPTPCHANYPTTIPVLKGDVSGQDPIITGGVPGTVAVSLPAVSAAPGTVIFPIMIGDTTGLDISSFDFQISFDPSVITPAGFFQNGTLSSNINGTPNWGFLTNASNSGHLIVLAYRFNSGLSYALSGSGTLLYLKFNVVGTPGQSTALTFEDYTTPDGRAHQSYLINEGTPSVTTTNGSVTIFPASVSGTVTYGNALATQPPHFVSNVTITGAGSPTVTTINDSLSGTGGQYSLAGFGSGAYTITPSKTGGVNSITSYDAGLVAAHVAGNARLVGNQLVVADTSNNGAISSFDAALIGNYVVNAIPHGIAGTWKFFTVPNVPFPVGATPTSRTYPSVASNITGEDYTALLMGEVSGNWFNSDGRPGESSGRSSNSSGPERSTAVKAPQLMTPVDKDILIPVSVQGSAKKGIISYEFDLRYDPSVIQPQAIPVELAGTVSSRLAFAVNANEPGLLRVAVYGPMPISYDGVLLNLKFTAVGKPGSVSPLTWERIMFNEGESHVNTADGQIELF